MKNNKKKLKKSNLPVLVTLGGMEYELKCTNSVLRRFCSLRECTMSGLFDELDNYVSVNCFMYCMLNHADPALTSDKVEVLLDEIPVRTVIELAYQAMINAIGCDDDNEADENEAETEQREDDPMQAAEATGEKA